MMKTAFNELSWVAVSRNRSNVEQLSEDSGLCPYALIDGEFKPSDGHYEVFDYLYHSVGLRNDCDDKGLLEDALIDFLGAVSSYMNSGSYDVFTFTFKPDHGGATYFLKRYTQEEGAAV